MERGLRREELTMLLTPAQRAWENLQQAINEGTNGTYEKLKDCKTECERMKFFPSDLFDKANALLLKIQVIPQATF